MIVVSFLCGSITEILGNDFALKLSDKLHENIEPNPKWRSCNYTSYTHLHVKVTTAKPGKEKTASQNRFQLYCLDTIMMKIVSEVFPLAGN